MIINTNIHTDEDEIKKIGVFWFLAQKMGKAIREKRLMENYCNLFSYSESCGAECRKHRGGINLMPEK